MKKTKLLIANWKMELSHNQSIAWLKKYGPELITLAKSSTAEVTLCSTFTCLDFFQNYLHSTPVKLGAQSCSIYTSGAYTGDVSAVSLKELQCTYCIIGHTERRRYHHETDQQNAQKAALLFSLGIIPVVCIGETLTEKNNGRTFEVLQKQLDLVLQIAQTTQSDQLVIAYEPVWAIGTGKAPELEELQAICIQIKEYCSLFIKKDQIRVLYGGSVNAQNVEKWLKIAQIDGFLLGKASLDFQELKKIVVLVSRG